MQASERGVGSLNARPKFRWEPAWQSYVPDGYETLEPLGEGPLAPEVEAPRDPVADLREAFAGMSVEERTAKGAGNCHLHPARCGCFWCETISDRARDHAKAQRCEW